MIEFFRAIEAAIGEIAIAQCRQRINFWATLAWRKEASQRHIEQFFSILVVHLPRFSKSWGDNSIIHLLQPGGPRVA
ncbi:hypothetical protein D3C72_2140740 [compost metagenome]